jgi:uncharacterized protein YlxW (UPF0749 family)
MDPSKQFLIRRSEQEDPRTLRKRIEELEKENYSFNRRLEDTENQLNEKVA